MKFYSKKIFATSIYVFALLSSALSQQNDSKNFFYKTIKGSQIICKEKVITYIAPSQGAAIDDSLYFGTSVNILMIVPYSESVHGIEVPWVKCIYKKGEYNKVTFILANNISLVSSKNNVVSFLSFDKSINDSLYFKVHVKNNTTNNFNTEAIALNKEPLLDSLNLEEIGTNGLKNITNIFALHFFTNNTKHSYHYLTCSLQNNLIVLEKTEQILVSNSFSGKQWLFPNSKKVKKNTIVLMNLAKKELSINKFNATIYKLKNCSIQ